MTTQTQKLYETDFNLWLETTAQLLRERRLDQIDYENLIEEIEDMGNSEKNALESNLRILLMHLIKWRFQASKRSNSWRYTIIEHSLRINKAFKKSPSLKRYFDEVFEECYQDARLLASGETGLAEEEFPVTCPFLREDVLNPKYLPDEEVNE
ncbi:DUF29 domain-containing protein [Gloeothece verrucosa]|uniref:DUF29 domain-containing protein n=1 Tax=Gloeothece verrucosa (strain PCC 7822) TaxID=497965 RepID=E0U8X8_GLOV7|nr:DUF29 domain-containing protein [Gloeothece verrucosa]ADN16117.1 protein of unknown function DUF29 [Gloeothece verrucosa PCC 7822]